MRASDAERESVVDALRRHAGAGRLEPAELERRIERAYAAERRGDLAALTADLPPLTVPVTAPRATDGRWAQHARRTLVIAIMLVAIWALTGAEYFWPIWPIGAMALSLFSQRPRHARSGLPIRLG
jgi:hypothetical protein